MKRGFRFALILPAVLCAVASLAAAKKVIVIGVDGMDPKMLQAFVDEGIMPNFQRLMREGDFKPLQTSMPPQSPVAWSNFITGMDSGGHGIFDFVHRDPATMAPYLSMARALPPSRQLRIGTLVLPLEGGKIEQLRQGKAFWQILEEHKVPTIVYKMPANFPPAKSPGKSLSGMGTPDILGTPGTFSFYTNDPEVAETNPSGGQVFRVTVKSHRVDGKLIGPANPFRLAEKKRLGLGASKRAKEYEPAPCTIDFRLYMDPTEPVAKLVLPSTELILKEGEWSEWVRLDFAAVPLLVNISSIGRFYLQQMRPYVRLYVSPLQINPEDPAMPISTPADWCCQLCESLGYFYTKELPEETKALSAGIFSGSEFLQQADFVYQETSTALDFLLDTHDEGLLFFYYSSVDQQSHMLWRYVDDQHPGYDAGAQLRDSIRRIYTKIDNDLGRVLERIDEKTTLVVMSDHGFGPFYRGVNLNSWLVEKGYVKLLRPSLQGDPSHKYFDNVDWQRTKAYALGLNGLYLNLEGREKNGVVPATDYDKLLDQLERDLLELRDPQNGAQVVTLVHRPRRDFHGPYKDRGPDILVGYNTGYRSSWESPLGEFPKELFVDNLQAWSADHCVDYRLVPGILLTNQRITLENPALVDLTVAVLDEFGVAPLPEMIGKDCLGPRTEAAMSRAEEAEPGALR